MNSISVFYEHITDAVKQSGLSLQAVCARVRGFGFDSVELDCNRLFNEPETVLSALENAGLGVNCIYYFFDFGAGEDCLKADMEAAEKVIACCARAKCDKILVVPGFLKENEMERGSAAYETRRRRMARSISAMLPRAAEKGIRLVMEDFDGETAPFATREELLWFMENAKGLGCGFDTGNFLFSEQDAAAALPEFLPYIAAVHCKDRAMTRNDGEVKMTVKGRALYPAAVGDGDLPIRAMMETILETGYTGAFAAEHFGSAAQLRDMERSAKFLLSVLREWYAK